VGGAPACARAPRARTEITPFSPARGRSTQSTRMGLARVPRRNKTTRFALLVGGGAAPSIHPSATARLRCTVDPWGLEVGRDATPVFALTYPCRGEGKRADSRALAASVPGPSHFFFVAAGSSSSGTVNNAAGSRVSAAVAVRDIGAALRHARPRMWAA
jgi:hypothetical protein